MCQPGDILIIWANEERERSEVLRQGHQARVLIADENNRSKEVFYQTLTPNGETLEYNGYETANDKQLTNFPVMVEV